MKWVITEFAREKVVETPGEELLEEEIKNYEQVHLAVSCMGRNYREKAREEIARLAINNGCRLAVDADYCRDNHDNNSVILAATGLRKNFTWQAPERNFVALFARRNMSHISDSKFLGRMGKSPEDYEKIDLAAVYAGINYLRQAELALAKKAMQTSCSFVAEMDYVFHEPRIKCVRIEAKGLIKKILK